MQEPDKVEPMAVAAAAAAALQIWVELFLQVPVVELDQVQQGQEHLAAEVKVEQVELAADQPFQVIKVQAILDMAVAD
jgi:hypothetical protein